MVSTSLFFDFSKYCPYLVCGERIESDEPGPPRFCMHCGMDIIACTSCHATNRLLAGQCRGCGADLASDIWPLHIGLRTSGVSLQSIESLDQERAPIRQRLGVNVLAQPIAADGLIAVPMSQGGVVLLSELSGRRIGQVQVDGAIEVTPALSSGFLYAASLNGVSAFNLARVLDQPGPHRARADWTFQSVGDAIVQPLLLDHQSVFVVARTEEHSILEAVSQADGRRLWPRPVYIESTQTMPPALVKDRILLLTLAGTLYVIDPATGETLNTSELGRRIDAQVSPFVLNNRVLFADEGGAIIELVVGKGRPLVNSPYTHRARITSLSAADELIAVGHVAGLTLLSSRGSVRWSDDNLGSITVMPIIAGNSIFALDDTGNGLLFDAEKPGPIARARLLPGDVVAPPLITRSRVTAVSGKGDVVSIGWR